MTYDLAIIGGGITGLGIARLAARNGFSCVVLERGDLASGASSRSSHMLHGGLRYLEHGHLVLVREALGQRAAVTRMAPTLAHVQRFLVPLYRGDRIGLWQLRLGLSIYDLLAGPAGLAPHGMARARETRVLEPALDPAGLRGAGLYSDAVMDDARLAVAVARDAARHGATILTYTEVCSGRHTEEGTFLVHAIDRLEGGERGFHARVVVNAAGPWVDEVRTVLSRTLSPGSLDPAPLLRPSRGTHLVFPRLTHGHGLLLTAQSDRRVFFVVPFGEHSLVGTTEVEIASPPPPGASRPTPEEVRYLRAELRRVLPGVAGVPPIAVTAGLRPLLRSESDVGSAPREHRVVDEDGIVTIAGGKYTTFRLMARDVMTRVQWKLRHATRPLCDPLDPLPAPLRPGESLEAIAAFAVEHEFARRVVDVVRRRTALWLEPDRGRVAAPPIAAVMAARLGWSAGRAHQEFQSYDAELWEEEALLQRTRDER